MKTVIVGAGGYAKEIAFLLARKPEFELLGFADDRYPLVQEEVCGKPILGKIADLLTWEEKTAVVLGIANPAAKQKIYQQLKQNPQLSFPNLVDETALVGFNIRLGIGNVLMPYTTYTSDITIGDFNMFNMHTTIGHDTVIGDFNAFFPSVNISGNVTIQDKNQFGVGTKVIQGLAIGTDNIIGA